jgi:hypothetical protein
MAATQTQVGAPSAAGTQTQVGAPPNREQFSSADKLPFKARAAARAPSAFCAPLQLRHALR